MSRPWRSASPARYVRWRLCRPHQREARDRLSRARLANDAERLAPVERVGEIRHRTDVALVRGEDDRQVANIENYLAHSYRTRGSRNAYEDVHDEVHEHHGDSAEHDDADDRWQILVERRGDREPAEALGVEDRLGDDRTADEEGDVHPEHRHDRRQARPQRMVCDHAPLRETLRSRGSDVVLSQCLEQRVTRHPRVDRREQQREHGPGQDHVREEAARVHR